MGELWFEWCEFIVVQVQCDCQIIVFMCVGGQVKLIVEWLVGVCCELLCKQFCVDQVVCEFEVLICVVLQYDDGIVFVICIVYCWIDVYVIVDLVVQYCEVWVGMVCYEELFVFFFEKELVVEYVVMFFCIVWCVIVEKFCFGGVVQFEECGIVLVLLYDFVFVFRECFVGVEDCCYVEIYVVCVEQLQVLQYVCWCVDQYVGVYVVDQVQYGGKIGVVCVQLFDWKYVCVDCFQ